MTRRLRIAVAVAAGLALLGWHPAAAQDARWSGGWTVEPVEPYQVRPELSFTFRHLGPQTQPGIERVEIAFVPDGEGDPVEGCEVPPPTVVEVTPERERGESSFTSALQPPLPCNGGYTATATAFTGTNTVHAEPEESPPAILTFELAVPPPSPTALEVEAEGRFARLEWSAPDPLPPDLVGYVVERSRSADGGFEAIGDSVEASFVDDGDGLADGGLFHYRVRAVRLGPGSDLIASEASPPASVELGSSASTSTIPTTTGGGSTPAGSDRSGFGQVQQEADRLRPGGNTGVPPVPPTTGDTGFDQTLPFDPAAPTAPSTAPAGPPGESGLAGASLQTFDDDDGGDRRAVLGPVAGALALLVVFLQLRWLLRQASTA